MADLLELQINRPEVVALAFADGREFPSKIAGAPPQVMFTLVDGRRVFWPQPFAERLRSAGIGANTPFEVCKAEIAKGRTQLQFKPLAAPTPTPAPPPPPPPPVYAPAPVVERLYTAPAPRPEAPVLPALPSNPVTPASAKFLAAYMVAIDTLIESQVYAKRKGLLITVTCEDVRCLAATLIIDSKQGGR